MEEAVIEQVIMTTLLNKSGNRGSFRFSAAARLQGVGWLLEGVLELMPELSLQGYRGVGHEETEWEGSRQCQALPIWD